MINDPIADMLTRIRNANQRKHKGVSMPFSKQKEEISKILLDEGYISDYKIKKASDTIHKNLLIILKYKQGQERVIQGLKRISKPGLRVYSQASDLPTVLNGFGIAIVTTSKGTMTASKARKLNLGGEVMAFV